MAITVVQTQGNHANGTSNGLTLGAAPTQGNLLVVMASGRSGETSASISGTGWTQQVSLATDQADANNRKYLAVWWKVAGASESSTITVSWSNSARHSAAVTEFTTSGGESWSFETSVTNGLSTLISSISTGTTSSVTNTPMLLVGCAHVKTDHSDSSTQVPNTWTNSLASAVTVDGAGQFNGANMGMGWLETSATGTKESTVSWTNASGRGAQNSLLVFSLSSGGTNVNVGQVTETDTAQPLVVPQSIPVGLVTETDTAQSVVANPDVLDVDFGGSLPSGWTFVDPTSVGSSLTHGTDYAQVSITPGMTADSINSVGSTDATVGLVHDISGNFDVAVRFASVFAGDHSTMCGFILRGASDAEMVRWTPYGTASRWSVYGYARSGGVGNEFSNYADDNNWFYGNPAWIRASRSGTTYNFYASSDGVNWTQLSQVTTNVDAITIKLALGQYQNNLGRAFRWELVRDLLTAGNTDARDAEPDYTTSQSQTTDFSSLPAWLSLESNADGSAVVTGGQLQLSTGSADQSYGRIAYVGTGHTYAGMLAKISWTATNGLAFGVAGLGVQDGGGSIDQYSRSPAYGYEIAGDTTHASIPLRVHRPVGTVPDFNESYTFLEDGVNAPESTATWWWYRVEVIDDRIRFRLWADGSTEPSTWVFDGEESILRREGPFVPYLSISHNDGFAVSATIVADELTFYELELSQVTNVNVGQGIETDTAQAQGRLKSYLVKMARR